MNINDIAKIAGVGIGTVSRVINNHPDVKDETRKKIQKIIKESNYVPNNSARNLKKSNTNTIGILVRGVFNPFFSEMINIISNKISENGYNMVLRHTDYLENGDAEVRNLIEFKKERRLKGIIYLGCDIREINKENFKGVDIPLVLASANCNYDTEINYFSSIGIRQSQSAFNATKYLIDRGHKNIAIVLGLREDAGLGSERLSGYIDALNENNIEIKENYIIYGKYSAKSAYNATKELIENNKEIDAIFCISDIMATGCIKALIDNDIKVGDEISVIGFDGMEVSEFYNPSITTVIQPRREIAEKSVDILFSLINNNSENRHIVLDTKLVERQSCREKL